MTELIAAFKALRLHGMAGGYGELVGNGGPDVAAAEWIVRHLLEAETTDRALRSVRYQMHAARFPLHRDLAGSSLNSPRSTGARSSSLRRWRSPSAPRTLS